MNTVEPTQPTNQNEAETPIEVNEKPGENPAQNRAAPFLDWQSAFGGPHSKRLPRIFDFCTSNSRGPGTVAASGNI